MTGHTKRLLRTDPLTAMVVGAFVRGLSMRDVESLCEEAQVPAQRHAPEAARRLTTAGNLVRL